MDKNNIIGTGLSGLVGSRITSLLSSEYLFEDLSRKTGLNITDRQSVLDRIQKSISPVVFHCAAKTDVDGCEDEKDISLQSICWKVNVEGTKNIVAACEATGKKLIYLSTDMVFDGEKPLGERYSEEDSPHPRNWYAVTKHEGEKAVKNAKIPWVILRIAYPYRGNFIKKEYVRIFISLLSSNKEISTVYDHYFTPTFVDDLANVFDVCIKREITGIYHAVGGQVVSPFDAAVIIARKFQLDEELIKRVTRSDYFSDRALRPFNLSLKNDKIRKLGLKMTNFDQGIDRIKTQL